MALKAYGDGRRSEGRPRRKLTDRAAARPSLERGLPAPWDAGSEDTCSRLLSPACIKSFRWVLLCCGPS